MSVRTAFKLLAREVARPILRSYATVFFSSHLGVGLLLLLATFCYPSIGWVGLAGTLLALAGARLLGFERAAIDDGRLLFNSLLSALGLGYWTSLAPVPAAAFWMLLVFVPMATVFATVLLNQLSLQLTGLTARSVPFCLAAIALHWMLMGLRPEFETTPPAGWETPSIPFLDLWFRSLSAILFTSGTATGLLMTAALLIASRVSFSHAIVGFAVSLAVQAALGGWWQSSAWLNLNAMLCAVALGGIFYLPSWASLVLAAGGAAFCFGMGLALEHALRLIDAPVLTLPFNFTLLAITSALQWREIARAPWRVITPGRSPEETHRLAELMKARLSHPTLPSITLPFEGRWIVTQGFSGKITHRGFWKFALDFEVANENQAPSRPPGGQLSDFPSFGAPILAPVAGRVARVIDGVRDNPIGKANLAENWGNTVVIEIHPTLYLQLSHFRCRGLNVREGDRVTVGQTLGFLGNSGRSPLPHLHVQMQTSPEIGAPTIPFCLHGFRMAGRGSGEFRFRDQLAEGDVVIGQRRAAWMAKCFSPLEPVETHFQISSRRGYHSESIQSQIQLDGSLLMTSSRPAELRLRVVDGILVPLSYSGSRHSLLAALSLCGRIPLHSAPEMEWKEILDGGLLQSSIQRWISDFWMPYRASKLMTARGHLLQSDAQSGAFGAEWHFDNGDFLHLDFDAAGLLSGRWEQKDNSILLHRSSDRSIAHFHPSPTTAPEPLLPLQT